MPLPWRNAELKSGSVVTLRPRIGDLVDGLAVEPPADLRVGAHALVGAVDDDFGLAAARDELHLHRRGLAGAQREVVDVLGGEPGLGHVHRVGAGERQRRDRRRAVGAGRRLARRRRSPCW